LVDLGAWLTEQNKIPDESPAGQAEPSEEG
jgi:endogenous inhibitor of DNA gyrase (YacG/DUF329 family)